MIEDVKELWGMGLELLGLLAAGRAPPVALLKRGLSKGLGVGLVGAAAVVKVPQIANIVGSGSAAGLSATAFETELVTYTNSVVYSVDKGLSFSDYGEFVLLMLQGVVLLGLIYRYTGASYGRVAAFTTVYVGLVAAALSEHVTSAMLEVSFNLNTFLMMYARLPQIYKNYNERGTGQLSVVTSTMNFAGCVARIFTSVVEGAGAPMIRSYAIATVLNGTILFQILHYSKGGKPKKAAKGKAGKKKTPAKAPPTTRETRSLARKTRSSARKAD